MKKVFCLSIIVIMLTVGCTNVSTATDTRPDIKFEVANFELNHNNSGVFESYSGKGTIIAVGKETLVKKPYLVLLEINRISGGSKDFTGTEYKNVVVYNGIGQFSTYDSEINDKLIKPNYEFKIIGYMPYIEIP